MHGTTRFGDFKCQWETPAFHFFSLHNINSSFAPTPRKFATRATFGQSSVSSASAITIVRRVDKKQKQTTLTVRIGRPYTFQNRKLWPAQRKRGEKTENQRRWNGVQLMFQREEQLLKLYHKMTNRTAKSSIRDSAQRTSVKQHTYEI